MKEIGSEFWLENIQNNDNNLDYLNIGKDYKLLMSGRTAIDYIINDITDNKKIVYMPNYCCESMVQPFIDNGYSIRYYNVDAINNKYNHLYHQFSSFLFYHICLYLLLDLSKHF